MPSSRARRPLLTAAVAAAAAALAAACASRPAPMWLAASPACDGYVSPDTSRVFEAAALSQPALPVRNVPALAPALPRGAPFFAAVGFVVDTAGRVEPCSVAPVDESHRGLAADLGRRVGRVEFQPAWAGRRRVRARTTLRVDGSA